MLTRTLDYMDAVRPHHVTAWRHRSKPTNEIRTHTHKPQRRTNETDSSQEINQFSEALYFVQLNAEWLIDLRVSGQLTLCALEMTFWPPAQATYQCI